MAGIAGALGKLFGGSSTEERAGKIHDAGATALEKYQDATKQNGVISAIQNKALEKTREVHTETFRQWDQTVKDLDQLHAASAPEQLYAPAPAFNMRGSPDPAHRAAPAETTSVSSLEALDSYRAAPTTQLQPTTPISVASLDALASPTTATANSFHSSSYVASRPDSSVKATCPGLGAYNAERVSDGERRTDPQSSRTYECRNGTWEAWPSAGSNR